MLITNGTVVTVAGQQRADVRIAGESIVQVAPGLLPKFGGEPIIDATGLLVLPGGVDPHTHLDLVVGGLRATDSFATGTVAAACGGTTTIIDHMGFGPAEAQGSLVERVQAYQALARGQAVVDYGFHGVIDRTTDAVLAELAELPKLGVTSLKFYMTYDGRLLDEQITALLERTRELGILACVHCENHEVLTSLRQRFVAEGKLAPHYHPLSRPDYCEAEAVERVLALAQAAGNAPIYIVHTSAALSLDAALKASANSFLETCPQYLVLDDTLYDAPDNQGLKYILSPPLRKPADQQALWLALADGRISTVGTDHCSWNFATQKQLGADDFSKCPNGMPGIELRLALLHSEAVVKRGLPLQRMVAVCSTLPAQIFGIYPRKGTIAPGSDADLVLFDPKRRITVSRSLLHENVDYTPYEGMELTGWPVLTISRGQVIARDGNYCGSPARGNYLFRK